MALGKYLAVLFDIDGTLIITGGAGAAAWRMAFDEIYGLPVDVSSADYDGLTDPEVGRLAFEAAMHRVPSRAEFTKLLERRLYYLYETVAESKDYRVLDGVNELLRDLIDRGYMLGLVTGNLEAAAHVKLHRAKLNQFFSFGGYGSDSSNRGELTKFALSRAALVYGESVSSDQCLVVGDTPHDVDGAHAADIACVGVASHNYSAEQLTESGADYVIASLAQGLPL